MENKSRTFTGLAISPGVLESAIIILAAACMETGAETMTLNANGLRYGGQLLGDWQIVVRAKNATK